MCGNLVYAAFTP
ncbi:hypothetical protein M2G69_21630 [Vibrio vulnificus]|nr:hypothetical protein [Vibrio vulnificus]MCU8186083.1 hypothetical protein [Vibrio vulnificus]MCU8208057.1 hypothetical protein [Vibrio vulnificus]MCU8225697.1 hypothetical protein [Vibrio vulnificus]MCU8247396.1 hypothetical protein [Vibrio vulnificus]